VPRGPGAPARARVAPRTKHGDGTDETVEEVHTKLAQERARLRGLPHPQRPTTSTDTSRSEHWRDWALEQGLLVSHLGLPAA